MPSCLECRGRGWIRDEERGKDELCAECMGSGYETTKNLCDCVIGDCMLEAGRICREREMVVSMTKESEMGHWSERPGHDAPDYSDACKPPRPDTLYSESALHAKVAAHAQNRMAQQGLAAAGSIGASRQQSLPAVIERLAKHHEAVRDQARRSTTIADSLVGAEPEEDATGPSEGMRGGSLIEMLHHFIDALERENYRIARANNRAYGALAIEP